MAQKVLVQLVDDLDGTSSQDISTVLFGLDGVEYEIDLSDANAQRLRDATQEFVDAARRTSGRRKPTLTSVSGGQAAGRKTAASVDPAQGKVIRDWWRSQGHEISDRGRIPGHVVDEYNAATKPAPKAEKPAPKAVSARGRKRSPGAAKAAFSAAAAS